MEKHDGRGFLKEEGVGKGKNNKENKVKETPKTVKTVCFLGTHLLAHREEEKIFPIVFLLVMTLLACAMR